MVGVNGRKTNLTATVAKNGRTILPGR
jgi:hypothetical protein